jgi:hypothetical protein
MSATSARRDGCLSDLLLDQLIAGELVGGEGDGARSHLDGCAACRTRRAELDEAVARFDSEVFVEGLAAQAVRRTRGPRFLPMLSAGVAAVAALILVVLLRPPAPDERTKGGAVTLALVVRHVDGSTERVVPGALLRPNEAIRFELTTARAGFVGVVGLDSAQVVSAYAPASGTLPALPAGRAQLLDGSVILDNTAGAERIVAVVCAKTRSIEDVAAAAKRALARAGGDPRGVGALEIDCDQSSFVFAKAR